MFDDRLALALVVALANVWAWYERRKQRVLPWENVPREIDIPLPPKEGHVHIGSIDIPLPPVERRFADPTSLGDADRP